MNVSGTFVDSMREIAGREDIAEERDAGKATDAYFLLDLSLSAKPISWLTLYVNGRNLTNQAYIVSRRPFGARPGAPLSVQGGAKVEF